MAINAAPSATSFGTKSRAVTPNDGTDITNGPVKAVVCLSGGDISILPAGSDLPISFVGVVSGFVPPFQVRRVLATGTTCAVATVED